MSAPINSVPDLTQRPPRSMRVRLGGYAILPRMLDKCRATIAGKNGDYHFNCPLDQHFIKFVEIDPEALKAVVARGLGDWEILEWIQANSKVKPSPWVIAQWSAYHDQRGPDGDVETLEYFTKMVGKVATNREDIRTWADALDLDDYVSFGGKA